MIEAEIELTQDGSHTLKHPILGDFYHSTRGAVGEAQHVFIKTGLGAAKKESVNVFEVGFGSGLNALLTLMENKTTEYHAVELYPLSLKTIEKLNYISPSDPLYQTFISMHTCAWNEKVNITEKFKLKKYHCSLLDTKLDTIFDVIYFDAFSPETQPELWSVEVFKNLYDHTLEGGVLVTYSSKGIVKRALREVGYTVERVEGALGKRHMLVAKKINLSQETTLTERF